MAKNKMLSPTYLYSGLAGFAMRKGWYSKEYYKHNTSLSFIKGAPFFSLLSSERLERGGGLFRLFKLRQMGLKEYIHMKAVLGWFIRLVVSVQEIFLLPWML